jgi:HPt (histidine-containing phosphotransfer) domain-containing protein
VSPEVLRFVRIDELIENVAGSEEIAVMVVDEFLVHVEPQMLEIGAAVERGDFVGGAATAHRFKGSLAAISATTATCTAGALEKACLRHDRDAMQRELADLRPQVESVVAALHQWRSQTGSRKAVEGKRHV